MDCVREGRLVCQQCALFELNKAFSAQSLAVVKEVKLIQMRYTMIMLYTTKLHELDSHNVRKQNNSTSLYLSLLPLTCTHITHHSSVVLY